MSNTTEHLSHRTNNGGPPMPEPEIATDEGQEAAHTREEGLSAVIQDLAAKSPIEYDRIRQAKAEELGVRLSTLDQEVQAARKKGDEDGPGAGQAVAMDDPEPCPEPVDGADLLDDLVTEFSRYIALPHGAAEALALWVVHTHAHDANPISPLLALTSPEKRCGKTTVLQLLKALVPRPLPASNITPAALFRTVEKYRPTVLVDEADTFLRDSDELRGILNSGHSRASAFVVRVVGDDHEPRQFATWAPKAVALIGRLPDTLADRSVMVSMRRRLPDEVVETLRPDRLNVEPIRQRCARWVRDHARILKDTDPAMPEALNDRAADNWRPLLTIAEVAGWREPAETTVHALAISKDEDDDSATTLLLGDLRDLFDKEGDRLPSAVLVERLTAMEDRPWPEWRRGQPITARGVAKLLSGFGIYPGNMKLPDGTVPKGYRREDCEEAFRRYLGGGGQESATPLPANKNNSLSHVDSATAQPEVADEKQDKHCKNMGSSEVADSKGQPWEVTL